VPAKAGSQQRLGWIAEAFLLPWCLLAITIGAFGFVDASARARAFPRGRSWHEPIPVHASLAVFVVWGMSMNLLLPGLVTGVIAITGHVRQRLPRACAFAALVVGGFIAGAALPKLNSTLATPRDFVHDGRLSALILISVALVVALGGAKLLGLGAPPRRWPSGGQAMTSSRRNRRSRRRRTKQRHGGREVS
jgi:hypothetical protein